VLNPVTYTDAARKSYIRIRHMLTHTDATHTYTHIRMRHIRTHTYGCDTYVHTHMDATHTYTHIRMRHIRTHTHGCDTYVHTHMDATHTYTHIRMRHIRTHTHGCDTYVHTHMDSAHTRTHTGSAGVLDPVTSKLCEFEDGDNLLERIDDIYVRLDKDGSGARGCVGTPLVFPQASQALTTHKLHINYTLTTH